MHEFYFSAEIIDWFWSNVRSVLAQYINIFTILFLISEWWFWLFHDFFSSRHNRLILIQFFDPFWRKPMHHNQSKLLFPFIYSRSIYFISAAFSQSVTTFHLLQQNSKMEKYLIEISFFPFQAGRNVRDLFEDLRDGHNLLSLLEVLSGEVLVRIILSCQLTFWRLFQ